ncbi:hypothetical protein Q7M56_00125 [Candidatus Liberibacter asiaticus]
MDHRKKTIVLITILSTLAGCDSESKKIEKNINDTRRENAKLSTKYREIVESYTPAMEDISIIDVTLVI